MLIFKHFCFCDSNPVALPLNTAQLLLHTSVIMRTDTRVDARSNLFVLARDNKSSRCKVWCRKTAQPCRMGSPWKSVPSKPDLQEHKNRETAFSKVSLPAFLCLQLMVYHKILTSDRCKSVIDKYPSDRILPAVVGIAERFNPYSNNKVNVLIANYQERKCKYIPEYHDWHTVKFLH